MVNLEFILFRILDLSFIYTLYFFLTTFISISINKIFGHFDEYKYETRSSFIILSEILLEIILLGIAAHYIRIIISSIPSPFLGIKAYNRNGLEELSGGVIFAFVIIIFQVHLTEKIRYLYKRIFKETIY